MGISAIGGPCALCEPYGASGPNGARDPGPYLRTVDLSKNTSWKQTDMLYIYIYIIRKSACLGRFQ